MENDSKNLRMTHLDRVVDSFISRVAREAGTSRASVLKFILLSVAPIRKKSEFLPTLRHVDGIIQRESEAVSLVATTSEKSSLRKIYKYAGLEELPAPLLRFGPVYYDASNPLDSAKEEAWKYLLDKFPNGDQDRDQKTEDIYLDAFGRVEEEARACYAGATLDGLSEPQFQWMMIIDGCFFLQLVLFILGASKELGYPDDHITFWTKRGRKVVHGWITCMFHVGNQIPLLVLSEFMKQDFFQDIIVKHGKWESPTELCGIVAAIACLRIHTLIVKLSIRIYHMMKLTSHSSHLD